ncbi:MAG: VWA domain-containing protein [Myxococcales bacterium]|nr:VWA domain-containing protein [Myxococcales bacterium]
MSELLPILLAPLSLGSLAWEQPAWIPVAAILGAIAIAIGWRRPEAAVAWPALSEARVAGAHTLDAARVGQALLRWLAISCLGLAIAGPLRPGGITADTRSGLDLLLVVDASGSMRALDAEVEGERRRRFDLAREAVSRFAVHRVSEGDRVGLVVFGDSAFTLCPLTRDGDLLAAALGRLDAGIAGEATALGDALALAVKRVRRSESGTRDTAASGPRAGQVVVLLTDGRTNAGSIPVDVAGALARTTGIRVHTVGIGSSGEVPMAGRSGGRSLQLERHDLDEDTLRLLAQASGGQYFAARTSADLATVYDEIDGLERVERKAPPRTSSEPIPEPFLAAAGLLLLLEIGGSRIFFRRIP